MSSPIPRDFGRADARKARTVSTLLASGVVVTAACVVYRSALSAYFFDDDFQWLVGSWSFGPRVFAPSQANHFYRPIIDVYFGLLTPLFAGSPVLFHLANVVIHAANGLLLIVLARSVSGSDEYGVLAALFFVVQPADVDTIAWVSALAEAIGAFFGCASLVLFLRYRQSGKTVPYALSTLAFALALMTHESSVVFLPLLALVDWASPESSRKTWTAYAPFALLLLAYLVVDLQINRQNYLVTQGHYALGWHMLANARDYLVALYVGKGNATNYIFIACVIAAVLASRSRRVLCGGVWIVVTLMPFVGFTWGTSFRYLYLPAMGFSMLVAEGILQLNRLLAARLRRTPRIAFVTVLTAALALRFMVFGAANVRRFASRTEVYREYISTFKAAHPALPHDARIVADAAGQKLGAKFLIAMIQWEYRDQSIELAEEPGGAR